MNLILVIGATGAGKSRYTAEKLLKNTVQKNAAGKDNYYLSPHSLRQYIFDVNNEYIIKDDRAGIFPACRHIDCNPKTFIANCKKINNSNIVWEDATGYLRGRQRDEFIQLIQKRRHVNNNWIILFHSIYRIPPELMEFSNYVILFKTNDNLKAIESKFNNEKINSAFLEIQKSKPFSFAQIKMQ